MKRILSVVLLGSLACLVALANDAELLTGPSPYFPRKTDCQEFAGVTYDYKQNLFDAKRTYDDAMQKAKTDYENWPNNYKPPHFFGAGVRIGISNSIMTAHKKARERYAEKKRTARTACAAAVKQAEDDMTTSPDFSPIERSAEVPGSNSVIHHSDGTKNVSPSFRLTTEGHIPAMNRPSRHNISLTNSSITPQL